MIRFPPKTVVAAIDSSDEAGVAWSHAERLRERLGCRLEAAFVDVRPEALEWKPGSPPHLKHASRKELLAALQAKIGKDTPLDLVEGDPVLSLLGLAQKRHADLIIVGPHQRGPASRVLQGSVTEALARQSSVPLLAARGPARTLKKVLAPVNGRPYSEEAFRYAAAAAAAFQAGLTALFISEKPVSEPDARVSALVRSLPEAVRKACRPRIAIRQGRPDEEIVEEAAGHDLVVLAAHRHGLLRDLLEGTTAERVARYAGAPVIVVPERKGAPAAAFWEGLSGAEA